MTPEDITVWRNIAIVTCIVAALWFLAVGLCREWVKSDLRKRMCEPVRLRSRPFASRTNRLTCSFKVVYSDFRGFSRSDSPRDLLDVLASPERDMGRRRDY